MTPDGTTITPVAVRGSGDGVHPWRVSVEEGDNGERLVRFDTGLIDGVEPTIGDGEDAKGIGELDGEGLGPALKVMPEDFGEDGICRIYVRVTVSKTWTIEKAGMVAAAKTPGSAAWVDHVLIALLVLDTPGADGKFNARESNATVSQRAFRDLSWVATERRANGFALYLTGVAK